jgi:hypothetical protein
MRSAANASAPEDPVAHVRDPLANRAAVLVARQRPMSERLALALSWNSVAAQLRVGLTKATDLADRR